MRSLASLSRSLSQRERIQIASRFSCLVLAKIKSPIRETHRRAADDSAIRFDVSKDSMTEIRVDRVRLIATAGDDAYACDITIGRFAGRFRAWLRICAMTFMRTRRVLRTPGESHAAKRHSGLNAAL